MCGWAALPALAFNEWKSQHKPTKIHTHTLTHTQCCSKKEVNEHTENRQRQRQRKKRASQRYIALLEWMWLWMNGQPDFQLRIKYTCRIFWWPQVSPLKSYSTCHLSVYVWVYVCVSVCGWMYFKWGRTCCKVKIRSFTFTTEVYYMTSISITYRKLYNKAESAV